MCNFLNNCNKNKNWKLKGLIHNDLAENAVSESSIQ